MGTKSTNKQQYLPPTYKQALGWRRWVISLVRFCLVHYYKINISADFEKLNAHLLKNTDDEQPAYVLIANHQNFWDVPLIILAINAWIDWVCKSELFALPLFGSFLYKWAAIPFDRKRLDLSAIKTILRRLQAKRIVGIFPQGHRCKNLEDIYKYQPADTIVNLIRKSHAKVLLVGIEGEFKFRSKLNINMREPFALSELYDADQSDAEIAYDLMKRVYNLANYTYPSYAELKKYKEKSNERNKEE